MARRKTDGYTITGPIWPMGAELGSQKKIDTLWENPDYIAEVKIDGERITANYENGFSCYTRSASNRDLTKPIEVSHRWHQMAQLTCSEIPINTILDGEAFSKIRRAEEVAGLFNYRSDIVMPDDITYIVFDCVQWGTRNLENEPWLVRRSFVEKAVNLLNQKWIQPVVYVREMKREFYETIIKNGGEGVVMKNVHSFYHQGKKPANQWVKVKDHDTFDCIITGFKPGVGKYRDMVGSLELSQYQKVGEAGELSEYRLVPVCYASGITDALRKDITANPEAYLGKVVVVDAFERIPNSVKLRQPRIKAIRPEGSKDPRDCII